jgi:hypothetical protein
MTYQQWCAARGVTHGHCPDGCEHPQPFMRGGLLLCGRCWFKYGEETEMVPCDETICEGGS